MTLIIVKMSEYLTFKMDAKNLNADYDDAM